MKSAQASVGNLTLGIILMLVAYVFFSAADTTTKWMTFAGYFAFQLAFIRYCFQLFYSGTETAFRGLRKDEIQGNLRLLILRGLALSSSSAVAFIAIKHVPLSVFSAIMFSSPFFVSILAWPLLGERVGPWRWIAIVLGFIGVLIIVRPFDDAIHWTAILLIYPALGLAFYSIITRKLAHSMRPHVMQFFTGLTGSIFLLPFALYTWTPLSWFIFGLMAWVGFASWFGHEILTRAHQHAPASLLMPYSYSFIIYLSIAGYFVFEEIPDALTILGALVIVASGLLLWHRETQAQSDPAP